MLGASLPNRCLLCHQGVARGQTGLCSACLGASLYQQPVCLGCGRGMTLQLKYCGSCQQSRPLPVVAPASYHQGLGPVISGIKYQGQMAALESLCQALVERFEELEALGLVSRPQALLPVPLHPGRLRERGFNQAWMIANRLSVILGIPLVDDCLVRTQHTLAQAGLDGKARRQNLKQAFELQQALPYPRVAIIDDVVTTGTTVSEIAAQIRVQAPDMQVWCLARAEAPGLLD
nr:ComF family protein [Shewanella submarina]